MRCSMFLDEEFHQQSYRIMWSCSGNILSHVIGHISNHHRVKDHFNPSLLLLLSQQQIKNFENPKSLDARTV